MPDFYLASSEGYGMEEPRRAWRIREMSLGDRDQLLLAQIDPPLLGEIYGVSQKIVQVVLLAPRHKGRSLFPNNEWPLAVHVSVPLVEPPENQNTLRADQVKLIAWAELYATEEAARGKE